MLVPTINPIKKGVAMAKRSRNGMEEKLCMWERPFHPVNYVPIVDTNTKR
jgi:hypothetical protein